MNDAFDPRRRATMLQAAAAAAAATVAATSAAASSTTSRQTSDRVAQETESGAADSPLQPSRCEVRPKSGGRSGSPHPSRQRQASPARSDASPEQPGQTDASNEGTAEHKGSVSRSEASGSQGSSAASSDHRSFRRDKLTARWYYESAVVLTFASTTRVVSQRLLRDKLHCTIPIAQALLKRLERKGLVEVRQGRGALPVRSDENTQRWRQAKELVGQMERGEIRPEDQQSDAELTQDTRPPRRQRQPASRAAAATDTASQLAASTPPAARSRPTGAHTTAAVTHPSLKRKRGVGSAVELENTPARPRQYGSSKKRGHVQVKRSSAAMAKLKSTTSLFL